MISEPRFHHLLALFPQLAPILVVGDVGLDKYTFGEVKRISPEAPVPVLEVTKEWTKLGLAANVAHNLATLQVKSHLCGVVGDDESGRNLLQMLSAEGIGPGPMVVLPGRPTTFKERITTSVQQICRVDYESAGPIDRPAQELIQEKISRAFAQHQALIIQDYGKGMLTPSLLQWLIALGKEEQKLVAIDPGRQIPPLHYQGAGLLKPNLGEAAQMVQALGYQQADVVQMAEILVDKLHLDMLVITMGADGMALLEKAKGGGVQVIPTVAREVFDVSGAGDTVISSMVTALGAGASLEEAAWIGNCAAGVVVAKKGTATVNCQELLEFYQNYQNYQSHQGKHTNDVGKN